MRIFWGNLLFLLFSLALLWFAGWLLSVAWCWIVLAGAVVVIVTWPFYPVVISGRWRK